MRVLSAFGFSGLGPERSTFLKTDQVVQLGVPPNRIDILTTTSGVEFDDARCDAFSAELDSRPVRFIGKPHLIKNKLASGRAKDLGDVSKLSED